MATTIPTEFTGFPILTLEKAEIIKDWYRTTLGDSDKADTAENEAWYTAQHEAYEAVLRLLYNMPPAGEEG